jgi:hypothetical protein
MIDQRNDSENAGITWNVVENKRPKMNRWGITWNVYEK